MAKTSSKQNTASKGFFGLLNFKSSSSKQRVKADLGQPNKLYFDEKRKMWVEKGNESAAEEFANPPPPPSRVMSPASDDQSDSGAVAGATPPNRKLDPSERYAQSSFGGMKEKVPSAKSLKGLGLHPKSRPLSPSNTFTPDAMSNGNATSEEGGNVYGGTNHSLSNGQSPPIMTPRDQDTNDIYGQSSTSLYGVSKALGNDSIYDDSLHGSTANLAAQDTDKDEDERENGNLYQGYGYDSFYSTKSKKQQSLYGNQSYGYGNSDVLKESVENHSQQEQEQENENAQQPAQNFGYGYGYGYNNEENSQQPAVGYSQNDNVDDNVDNKTFQQTDFAENTEIQSQIQNFDSVENYEEQIATSEQNFFTSEEYNEAYAHYGNWIQATWGEYTQSLSEAEQQQVFADVVYCEQLYNQWGATAYGQYCELFPQQASVLFSGQVIQQVSDQQIQSQTQIEEPQTENQTSLETDQYQGDKHDVLEVEGQDTFAGESQDQQPVQIAEEAQVQDLYQMGEFAQQAQVQEQEQSSQGVIQTEQINSILQENNDMQKTNPQSDVQIYPYPSLESWVDVPFKKLALKGKIQGYTPWKQDMDLTETEEDNDSVDDEPELQNGQILGDFSNSNKLHKDDEAMEVRTPRFDLSPHPSDANLGTEEYLFSKKDSSQLFNRQSLYIVPPQGGSDEMQPVTPNSQLVDQIQNNKSNLTSPESNSIANDKINSLQQRILELENLLSSKSKELDVVQKSQNDLLIAFGQEVSKVDKLRSMLLEQGMDEDVVDTAIEEVEDEFGWGDGAEVGSGDDEGEEEEFMHQKGEFSQSQFGVPLSNVNDEGIC